MEMKVKEVADLVGVSVRTLHHYDQIGLFSPKKTSESGYRIYREEDLEKLQQILFFKELGFSLKNIKMIINSPSFNQKEALVLQREMLNEKRSKIDKMIETIDKTIKHTMGEIHMTTEERFQGINFKIKLYEQEARMRWGDQPVDKINKNIGEMTRDERQALAQNWDKIFNKLSQVVDFSPDSQEVQTVIKEWYVFLNENFGKYSLEAFYGLGQLYIKDERFKENIDQYGEGLTMLMSEAMKFFSVNQKNKGARDENND